MGSTALDDQTDDAGDGGGIPEVEHFKPTGTLFILALFAATTILLWASVYIILLSRGVTL